MPQGEQAQSDAAKQAALARALLDLDAITRRLRRDCPWDREQAERTIVPHTIEEAYELAEAAHSGDDAKLLDELGDVLFQVHFLALLLEERGEGDLAEVARGCSEKLVRRHPHVFDAEEMAELPTRAETPAEVRRNWDVIKRSERGGGDPLAGVPQNLPALLYARKLRKRGGASPDRELAQMTTLQLLERLTDSARHGEGASSGERAASHGSPEAYDQLGDLLFEIVGLAQALEVDPEIALRRSADRFREQISNAQNSGQKEQT